MSASGCARWCDAARRLLVAGLAGLSLCATAHEYPEPGFTIIHPWVQEAPKGTRELVVSMRIVQINADDRLLSAWTPVGAALELRVPAALREPDGAPGIPLSRGRDLNITPFGPHLVLRDVNTDLRHGYEYPLTLVFAKAGTVEAGLIVGTH